MNLFKATSAPWLLTAIVAIIAFFMTGLVEELRSGRTLVYRLDDDGATMTATLWNVSRTHVLRDLDIQLTCDAPPCFRKGPAGRYDLPQVTPPIATPDLRARIADEETVGFELTLLPGARLDITLFPVAPQTGNFRLFYVPGTVPQPLVILQSWSITGWTALNYFRILSIIQAIALSCLAGYLIYAVYGWIRPSRGAADETPAYRVLLSRDRDRDTG
jgi:hypothetical protein